MEARVDEIGAGIYRLSIFVPDAAPPAGFTYNHFLFTGDEPLLFSLREAKNVSIGFRCGCSGHAGGATTLAWFRPFRSG
jgi:hypothetical protein